MGDYRLKLEPDSAPTLDVKVCWGRAALEQFRRKRRQIEDKQVYKKALLDTGAHFSFISRNVVDLCGLRPTGYKSVRSPVIGSAPIEVLLFPVQFQLARWTPTGWKVFGLAPDIEAGLLPVTSARYEAILGIDVLAAIRFLYDGPAGELTISERPPDGKRRRWRPWR